MSDSRRYPVLAKAREISQSPKLDILELRKALGVPLANDVRRWLAEQSPSQPLRIDFAGVRAVTLSVAEELGPQLLQAVARDPGLEQRYPVLALNSYEPAYTFASALDNAGWAALAVLGKPAHCNGSFLPVLERKAEVFVVLGAFSKQTAAILTLAERRAAAGEALTSEDLKGLDFLAHVSAAARSKRLTELHARRLLAFVENPRNSKERLFTPAWRL